MLNFTFNIYPHPTDKVTITRHPTHMQLSSCKAAFTKRLFFMQGAVLNKGVGVGGGVLLYVLETIKYPLKGPLEGM